MKFRLRLLLAAFAVSFLLVGALSAISISRFAQLSTQVSSVEHSYKVVKMINELDDEVRELDRNEFRFLVSGDSSFFLAYEQTALELKEKSDSLKELVSDNPTQHTFIIRFETDMRLYLAASRRSMIASLSPHIVHTSGPYQNSKLLMGSATQKLSEMATEENRLLKERSSERDTYKQRTAAMIKALSMVFGLLTLILFVLLLREFRSRVLYQAELQQKMMEIAQSKQELEYIAYATSHDLQEPLRKIRILSDKWQHYQRNNIAPEDAGDTLGRITAAAKRMQELVSELMILTTLSDGAELMACPLRNYVSNALSSLSQKITEKGARIEVEDLPVINGHPEQLKLLFKNLLDNALKFTRPGIAPLINITLHVADSNELGQEIQTGRKYYCITIKDNGLGFDNKMADKMFGIFRQLHTERDGYAGKGTGLAICQRIMSNHKGRIIAHGFPGSGATFKLYFPVGV